MTVNEKIKALRDRMSRHNIDIYIVPTCDFHGSEYVGDYFKTREFISGFTGSAGTVVVTLKEAALWTDGRYFLQAENQLKNTEIKLMKSGQCNVPTIREYLQKNATESLVVGFDGRMMTATMAEEIESIKNISVISDVDLVGEIWENRPLMCCKPVWNLSLEYCGKTRAHKLGDIREEMKNKEVDVLVLTSLEETAWTLNLRGDDVECTPVFLSFMLITSLDATLYVQKASIQDEIVKELENDGIVVEDYFKIYDALENTKNKKVWIDKNSANYNIVKKIKTHNEVINCFTPALNQKAIKNPTEISNMKKAHLLDGIAMTKFIYWLKTNVGKEKITELSLGEKLEEFRTVAKSYIEPSFTPIVGYNDHGAIVHYSANKESDYEIKDEGMVLIDSGGHYLEGTTDITRTISLGKVTPKMKKMYTAVLKGHLNLAASVFKEGCSGVAIDYNARQPLWDLGLDYNHGTGHGVGYLLSVHEPPNAIRYRILPDNQFNPVFKEGMITSNEPGVYLEGEFGIRIENLVLCEKKEKNQWGTFLCFKPLTLVPYDRELISFEDMADKEIELFDNYHKMVYEMISPYLTLEEKIWLRDTVKGGNSSK